MQGLCGNVTACAFMTSLLTDDDLFCAVSYIPIVTVSKEEWNYMVQRVKPEDRLSLQV
jgi:hypothetical protein